MTKYQINIENNNRKEIVIENFKSINDDIESLKVNEQKNHKTFFCDEYYKASLILEKITKNGNVSEIESCNKDHDCKNYKKNKKFNNTNAKNNIIIFSGERGSGKTSAMVSFGKYLENEKTKDEKNCRYKLLEMIDPSYFRKNESILLNVLTVMFKMARIYIEEAKYSEDIENTTSDFNELLRDFDKVFKSVNKMDSIIPEENSLEYLNELSNSIRLNESIYYLTQKFLKLFNDKHEYMVIMIDDLDMNISHASAMLEQIRKFLIHDNILILIATNIEQLQFEIKESYSRYYEKILHPMQNQPSVSVDVDDMATKYLLKLFPPLQRVHIGDASNKLINTNFKIDFFKPNGEKFEDQTIEDDLQRVILNLIWSKTRLLFINEDDQLHPIIPTNLRALHQLIYMLIEMDDIEEDKDENILFKLKNDYIKAQYNYNKFKDYILNIWIPSNVSFDEKKVFDNIPKDLGRINKHFIQSINVIGSKYKKTILIKDIDFEQYLEEKGKNDKFDRDIYTFVSPNDPKFSNANKISDIYNFPSNNTVGDILLLTDKYKTYFEATNQTKFIEAVKIYYTLLLFETMFFSSNKEDEKTKSEPIENDEAGKFDKYFDNISPIQRLIGGTFYFPHYFNLITSSKYDKLKENYLLKESIIKILNNNISIKIQVIDFIQKYQNIPLKFPCKIIKNLIKEFTKEEHKKASEEKLKEVFEDVLKKLTVYILKKLTDEELNKISEDVLKKFTVNALKMFKDKELNKISKDTLKKVFKDELKKLTEEELKKFIEEELKKLTDDELKKLTDDNLKTVLENLLEKYAEGVSKILIKDEFKKFTENIPKNVFEDEHKKFTIEELKKFIEDELKNAIKDVFENAPEELHINAINIVLKNASEDELKNAIEKLYYLNRYNCEHINCRDRNTLNMIMKSIINKPQLNTNKDSEDYLSYFLFNKIEKPNDIFFTLYYGKSRPPRSFGKHIYNTRFKDLDSESNDKNIRFDILSLLVNSLNSKQTIARFGTEYSKILGFDYNQIINWTKKYNNIDKSIPNFILPIYSVDLLLTYLRKIYDISELNLSINENDPVDTCHNEMRKDPTIKNYYINLINLTQNALSKIEPEKVNKELSKTKKTKDGQEDTEANKTSDKGLLEISPLYKNIFIDGFDAFIKLTDDEKKLLRGETNKKKKAKKVKTTPEK